MKALLIGSGGREHAIAEAICKSKTGLYAFLSSKNPGIMKLASKSAIGNLSNLESIAKFAKSVNPDFAVIGPELPLFAGVVDKLEKIGIPCVGPNKELAKLETSKCFTRMLLQKYGVPGSPYFRVFDHKEDMRQISRFLDELGDFVIKPDGLTGGKGVKLFGEHLKDKKEAVSYCRELFAKKECIVIEERLEGEEFSLQCLVDGRNVIGTPAVQDHKRAFAGDKGPNCYSCDTEILTEDGWETFDKLKSKDKVMTFNPNTKLLKFEKPEKIYWMRHNGRMIHFKHRELDLLVTPNHRMLVSHRKTKKIKILKAENFEGENEIFLSGIWKGKSLRYFILDEFDYKFNRKLKKQKIKFVDWVKFMGLFLSEGYISDTKEHRVYICQTKKSKHFKKFKEILSKLPFPFSYEERHSKFRINSVQLARILKEFGTSRQKFVPDYIKTAKKEHIVEFLDAFALGDGDMHYGRIRFHSGSKKLIDDLQELIIKIGKSGIITIDKRDRMLNPINKKYYKANKVYGLEIKPSIKVGIRKKDVKEINYDDYVGCVTVSTGFVVVRKNNRVAISGNTGGMGSYSFPNHILPFIKETDIKNAIMITEQVLAALREETGQLYKGVMYGGFIVTKSGIKLIEYNARFGDPEAMNILPLLETDFTEVCQDMINSSLNRQKIKFAKKATVCKYIVPDGYPETPKTGKIEIPSDTNAKTYLASVEEKEGSLYTKGSRAVAFVGIADTIEEAERAAEEACSRVKGDVFHRQDIGTKELIEKRINHMKNLRKLKSVIR